MSINMRKSGDLLGNRAADLSGAPMKSETYEAPGSRKWIMIVLAAVLATAIAYLIAGRERKEAAKPAFPLHAVRVRQGPEHMKAVRYVAAQPAGQVEARMVEDQGGTLVDGTYISDLKEVRRMVDRKATPAAVIVDPDGGADQRLDLPAGCDAARVQTMIGKEIIVHTEHWRWTGGRDTPIGRVVHTIDKPGIFEKLCGIEAAPRKTDR